MISFPLILAVNVVTVDIAIQVEGRARRFPTFSATFSKLDFKSSKLGYNH